VRDVARARRKGAAISVSISPFVPRPGTPFQWERQDSIPETRRKERLLRSSLMLRGLKLSLRDPRVSFLEGVMSRGDRGLSRAVEAAWRAGARFDGWTESFNFAIWERAFAETGTDPDAYLAERDHAAPLPWDHISSGVSTEYLAAERAKALRAETTADCREAGCIECGACGAGHAAPRALPPPVAAGTEARAEALGRRERKTKNGAEELTTKYRVRYVKDDAARFLSHLDIVRAVSRAIGVGLVPAAFSRGFNPHPRLSFGPPLPVGAAGEAEFLDIELVREMPSEELGARLASGLPHGLSVASVARRAAGGSVSSEAEAGEYIIRGIPGLDALGPEGTGERIAALMAAPSAVAARGRANREAGNGSPAETAGKEFVPAREILALAPLPGEPSTLRAVLRLPPAGVVRPTDLVRLLAVPGAGPAELALVRRTALLRRKASAPGGLEAIS
jgi:radical SAM-linked protein